MALFAFGALLGLAIAGYSLFTAKGTRSHSVPPEDFALINARPILRSDFVTQVQTQFGTSFEQSSPQQRASVLRDMLNEELLVQRGLEIDLPSFDPDVRAAMVAGVELEISADVLAQQPTPDQLQDYYLAHQGKYATEGAMRVRDFIIQQGMPVAAQAIAALRSGVALDQVSLRYGLVDSGRLMQAGHTDTGEIFEFAAKAKLLPPVYAAASALRGGEISGPIAASDGVHIVMMIEHRAPVPQSYAAVADRVWADYKDDAKRRVRDANLQYLHQRADILLSDDARALEEISR